MGKKDTRKQFFLAVFNRDKVCRTCRAGWKMSGPKFDAHHITPRENMPNGGYVVENGIFLCPDCHLEAERYLKAEHIFDWEIPAVEWPSEQYSPENLYKLIGSSYEKAVAASERLKGDE